MNRRIMKKQGGFTLVELAVVVAIVGLLLLSLKGVPMIMANYRANEEIANLPDITAQVQKHFYSDPDYSTLTTAIVAQYQLVPQTMINGTNIVNRWGGAVTFSPATSYTANDTQSMTYNDVPAYECREIVKGVEQNYLSISVNGTSVKALGGVLNDTTLASACATSNSIVFNASK